MVEITDHNSAEAWLETQDHQTQIWFATRCALRAMPGFGARTRYLPRGPVFGAYCGLFISSAIAMCPKTKLELFSEKSDWVKDGIGAALANAMEDGFDGGTGSSHPAPLFNALPAAASLSAISALYHSGPRRASGNLAVRSFDVSSRGLSASGELEAASLLRDINKFDAGFILEWPPLWHNQETPGALGRAWAALQREMIDEPEVWSFWIRWYQGILDGKPLDWSLVHRIVADLTESDLVRKDDLEGRRHVAGRIAQIEATWLAEQGRSDEVRPEEVSDSEVAAIFNNAPVIQASMASMSEATSLRIGLFDQIYRLNEEVPIVDLYRRLPESAGKISSIVEQGRTNTTETELALEVGRLRAHVQQLKVELERANSDLERFKAKPWYKHASVLLCGGALSSVVTGLWLLSGDDKSIQHRVEKLKQDYEYLESEIWPNPEDREFEKIQLELPKAFDV